MPIQLIWDLRRSALAGWSLGLLLSLVGCVHSSDPASAPLATEQVGSQIVVDTDERSAPVDPGCPDPSAACAADPEQPPLEPPPAPLPGPPPEQVAPLAEAPDLSSSTVATTPVQGKVGGVGPADSSPARSYPGPPGKRRLARPKGPPPQCDFPPIAQHNGISSAKVVLRVRVDAQGRATKGTPQNDPGYDFVPYAKACLQKMRFSPALDAQGRPTASTISITVQFRN